VKVQISIRGRTYTVRSDEDDVDIQEVAAYVDAQMQKVSGRSPHMDPYTVAMLAALNIASEFKRYTNEADRILQELDADLDVALAGTSASG